MAEECLFKAHGLEGEKAKSLCMRPQPGIKKWANCRFHFPKVKKRREKAMPRVTTTSTCLWEEQGKHRTELKFKHTLLPRDRENIQIRDMTSSQLGICISTSMVKGTDAVLRSFFSWTSLRNSKVVFTLIQWIAPAPHCPSSTVQSAVSEWLERRT